jgi:outer membrane protein OmpA-like peptidoglycan-associated protein
MRAPLIVALTLAAGLAIPAARAAPAFKAAAVVSFFGSAAKEQFRPVCVGAAADCPAPASAAIFVLADFPFASDRLTRAARQNLDEFAKALQDPLLKGRKFEIDGHADAAGAEPYNLELSARRASAVVAYLASRGLDQPYLLIAKGLGKTRPRGANPYSPDNRRVEARMFGAVR